MIQTAAKAGATSLIQPSGFICDQELIEEANRCSIAMLFTGILPFFPLNHFGLKISYEML